jgi:hypothetical protein
LILVEEIQGAPGYYYNAKDGFNYLQLSKLPPIVFVSAEVSCIIFVSVFLVVVLKFD